MGESTSQRIGGRGHPVIDARIIVEEALKLLDEVGVERLSMRRLADRTGVKAASLYWHVKNKDELLDLLADEICARVREPVPDLPWREKIATLVCEIRRVSSEHRDAALILARTSPTGPNRLRLADTMLEILAEAGFLPRQAAWASLLLTDYAAHFTAEEDRFRHRLERLESDDADGIPQRRQPEQSPATSYPQISLHMPYLTHSDADARFRFGLTVLLDGLEKQMIHKEG